MAFGRLREDAALKPPKAAHLAIAPRVPVLLDDVDVSEVCDGARFERVRIVGTSTGLEAHDVELNESLASSVVLSGGTFVGVQIIDVLFDGCDLSGLTLREATLRRVEFRDCRLSGLVLPEARLYDVRFVGCKLNDASLRRVVGERVHAEDSMLVGADFYGAKLSDARMIDCDLTGVDFSQSAVHGARFHGSKLDGLKGSESLRNIAIDTTQVLDLAVGLFNAYGIRVDGESATAS